MSKSTSKVKDCLHYCCGSVSGRAGIILADPDPYSFQPNGKAKLYFFQKNYDILYKKF
jgi:hypothetical protein